MKPTVRVAISNYHAGQIVQPVINANVAGRGRVKVDIYWLDRSDMTHLRPATFTGSTIAAESFLIAQGVHLDAQGIHLL